MKNPASTRVRVPLCRPDYGQPELSNVELALNAGMLEAGGRFTAQCEERLQEAAGCRRVLLVPSCTAALEMMALALDIRAGDEVIMPTYTFVSTANAIALRGGVPVFVDIEPHTLNIDAVAVEAAVTPRTRAVVAVHYAGVGCDLGALGRVCQSHDIALLEDAAQGYGALWDGKALGSFGLFGAYSFHHTKNVSCGEGGALLINSDSLVEVSERIQDKGTDRADFLRGASSKYEWQGLGSSFLANELTAAVLAGQLTRGQKLLDRRLALWEGYDKALSGVGQIRTPAIPTRAAHNAHIYHVRLPSRELRDGLRAACAEKGIGAAPHYIPLHDTPGGREYGRVAGDVRNAIEAADTLLRLPLYSSMNERDHSLVVDTVLAFVARHGLG